MAIVKRVKASMSEIDRGVTYVKAFPVDDNAVTVAGTKGIEWGSLVAVKGDGTSAIFFDNSSTGSGATFIKADATDESKEAVAIVITTSDKSVYAGLDLSNKLTMKPFGTDHENTTVPPVEEVVVTTYDDTKGRLTPLYNTVTTALTGTVEIAGTTALTGTGTAFDTELAVGDLVGVEGEIREVVTVTSATAVVVSEAFVGTASGKTAYQWTDYGRPVYLSATTAGDFTKIKPVTSGAFKQPVGKIVSGNHVAIKIEKGATIA